MIKPIKIKPQKAQHFYKKRNLGWLTESESLALRIEIAKLRVNGYWIKWKDERIDIKPNGDLVEWPADLYDTDMKLLTEFFKVTKERVSEQTSITTIPPVVTP